jgi:hypothetical protein
MSEKKARLWYWILFAVETCGLLGFLAVGLPVYRRLLSGPGGDRPGDPFLGMFLPLVVAMQVCYWSKRRFAAAVRVRRNELGGHLLLFVSRLTFVFVGSCFSVVFFVRSQDTTGSPQGIALFLAALFAIFCYVLELERLARLSLGIDRGGAT